MSLTKEQQDEIIENLGCWHCVEPLLAEISVPQPIVSMMKQISQLELDDFDTDEEYDAKYRDLELKIIKGLETM